MSFSIYLRPRQNGSCIVDDLFKCISWNENVSMANKISLKFVPKDLIDNIPALVQIMAWHRPDNNPLSEPMMFRLPMHICFTQPQWFNIININTNHTWKKRTGYWKRSHVYNIYISNPRPIDTSWGHFVFIKYVVAAIQHLIPTCDQMCCKYITPVIWLGRNCF